GPPPARPREEAALQGDRLGSAVRLHPRSRRGRGAAAEAADRTHAAAEDDVGAGRQRARQALEGALRAATDAQGRHPQGDGAAQYAPAARRDARALTRPGLNTAETVETWQGNGVGL